MSDKKVEAFLAHYGVKGMKWGIQKQDILKGRKRSKLDTDKKVGGSGPDHKTAANLMQAKYGSKESSAKAVEGLKKTSGNKAQEASDRERKIANGKKAAIAALAVVGVVSVAAVYIHSKKNPGLYNPFKFTSNKFLLNDTILDDLSKTDRRTQFKFHSIISRFTDMRKYGKATIDDSSAEKMLRQFPKMVVDAGKPMYRLSGGDISDPFLGKNYAYVNLREADNRRYQVIYKATIGGVVSGGEVYQHVFKAKKQLNIPSGNEVIDAAKAVQARYASTLDPNRNSALLPQFGLEMDKKGDFFKNVFMDVQGVITTDDYKKRGGTAELFKELQDRGFDGLPDFADYGRSTKSAVVLFNPTTKVADSTAKLLTNEMVIDAIKTAKASPFDD